MTQLRYCHPSAIHRNAAVMQSPGIARFAQIFDLYGPWVIPADRTGAITMPIHIRTEFPLPTYRPFTKSFEELCDERAREILTKAEAAGADINVMYSGGIDSTLTLVSLFKHTSPEQKKHIVVLLSHESIAENPRFYHEHIKGKVQMASSISFPERIGTGSFLVSGEHNDMVMGTEKIGKCMVMFGPRSVLEPYNRAKLTTLYADYIGGDEAAAAFHMDIFERIRDRAPIPIVSNMDFLWWINFAIKWQACYYLMLLFTSPRNVSNVTQRYLDEQFISFYNTDGFQLWSMNNLDKRIKDTWKSYKWVCKDIIYDYTKDAEYRDHKTKKASLRSITAQQTPFKFIDKDMRFSNDLSPEEFLRPDNDFV